MKRLLILPVLLLPMLLSAAETGYRIVHPDGTIEFTDDPRRGGQAIELQPAPTVPAYVAPHKPTQTGPAVAKPAEPAFTSYQQLRISSPQHDEVVWFDGSGITVSVAIQPALQQGHRIAIELNGEKVTEGTNTTLNFALFNPGTHVLSAVVIDQQGQQIKSADPVTFHFRRHTIRQ